MQNGYCCTCLSFLEKVIYTINQMNRFQIWKKYLLGNDFLVAVICIKFGSKLVGPWPSKTPFSLSNVGQDHSLKFYEFEILFTQWGAWNMTNGHAYWRNLLNIHPSFLELQIHSSTEPWAMGVHCGDTHESKSKAMHQWPKVGRISNLI